VDRVGLHLLADLVPGPVGQPHIQDDQGDATGPEDVERLGSGRRLDHLEPAPA